MTIYHLQDNEEESSKTDDPGKDAEIVMNVESENPAEILETETIGTSKRKLSKDDGNEKKRPNLLPIKSEPLDNFEGEENMSTETEKVELLRNPLAMANGKDDVLAEADSTQKNSLSPKGKKKVRRGPHTHFRGARIFKRKCLHCQINLHSKATYAKHMARFHSVVNNAISISEPQASSAGIEQSEPQKKQFSGLHLDAETVELIEDVEEKLPNSGEDAPLTPVQQNIISQLKTFSCYTCEQSFQDRRSTLNHIRQHMPDLRSYTCVACFTEFPDRMAYKQHCEASFECAMKIALVVPMQGTEKYFTCNMCLRPMPNRNDLLSHLSKHSDKQYPELMLPTRSPPKLTPIAPVPSPKKKSPVKTTRQPGDKRGPYANGDPAFNHKCDLCGMIYRYKPNMFKHRELCASLKPEGRTSYRCVHCGMTFLVFSKFHGHVTTEHKKKELTCPKCAAKFRSPSDYLTHHEFHRRKNNIKNMPALKTWNAFKEQKKEMQMEKDKLEVEIHEGEVHEEILQTQGQTKSRRYNCNLCTQNFSSKVELNEHRNLHLKVKIYSCVICRSMFSSAGALEIHMKDHGIEDPRERTANSSCMEYGHVDEEVAHSTNKSEAQPRKNECYDCGKTFSNYANLRRHIRNAHGEQDQLRNAQKLEKTVLSCPQCPKTFVFQANLDLHRRSAHAKSEKQCNHGCDICGRTFAEESSLKIHRGWHNRVNSRFSLENIDKDHRGFLMPGSEMRIPISPKPAKARKSFPNSSPSVQQKHHQLIELQCQVCDDKFYEVSELRKHVWEVHCARTTKPEKPFVMGDLQCELCTNVLPDQQSLESHMEWHERNPILSDSCRSNSFRCDICDKYYSSRKILWKHKKLHKAPQPTSMKFQSLPMKKPTCNTCGRSFTAESSLKRHKAMSPECQSYYSGRGFFNQQESRNPDDFNAKKKPVTCHICNTLFPSMSVLYQHKQLDHKVRFNREPKLPGIECLPMTSGEGGVTCNVCGKQFSGVSNLKQHFTIKHKNVSNHPCMIANCKMVFSTPHALKNHELTHSNMIYSCGLCERHFFHKVAIIKHIYSSHKAVYQSGIEESLYKETDLSTYVVRGATGTVCPSCGIKYPNIKAMKIHYFKFHETFA